MSPGVDIRNVPTRLGGGPTLVHKDLYGYSYRLNNAIRDAAEGAGLPLQHTVHGFYGTDSGALLAEGGGGLGDWCADALHAFTVRDAACRRLGNDVGFAAGHPVCAAAGGV